MYCKRVKRSRLTLWSLIVCPLVISLTSASSSTGEDGDGSSSGSSEGSIAQLGHLLTGLTEFVYKPSVATILLSHFVYLEKEGCKNRNRTRRFILFNAHHPQNFTAEMAVSVEFNSMHIFWYLEVVLLSLLFFPQAHDPVVKHSVHTLVFRSLKRTHDMFLAHEGQPVEEDELA